MLKQYHPLWMSIHLTHPDELTAEVAQACNRLADAGIPLGSQTVLLSGVNDNVETMKRLVHGLLKMRVKPYYLYQCDPIPGSSHFRTPVEKGLRKNKPHYRNSHGTDWVFLILLELTVLTGIFIHFARLLNWPAVTYTLYVIHMMAAVPLAVVQVPFAKWSHLAYRPVVLYLMKVKERHLREIAVPASAPAAEEIALQ